jgi:hypothetical protein
MPIHQGACVHKLLIFAILFVIALVAGYFFAQAAGILPPTAPAAQTSSQVRYLIIRTDDLNKSNPALLTIWGVIVSYSNPTTVYFSPVYPLQQNLADLASLFKLGKDRALTSEFMEALKKYNLDLTGYIIVDSTGADSYLNWLIPAKNRAASTPPSSTKAVQSLLNQQRQYFLQICQILAKPAKTNPQSLNWKSVYPDHLIPSPDIETIMTTLHRLFTDGQPFVCHVVE